MRTFPFFRFSGNHPYGRIVGRTYEEVRIDGLDDIAAVRRVKEGDTSAFRELVARYQRPLFAFVGKILRHPEDREDVVQEAFLSAYANLGSFDPRKGSFSAWIFRIARNGAFNALKKKRPATAADLPEPISAGPREPELFLALDRALRSLPVSQRTAFVLSAIEVPGLYRYGISVNKLYDYLAMGRPVITALAAMNNPVTEADAGIEVPPRDPDALAAAIVRMAAMAPAERDAMGRRGRRHLETHYDYRILARRYAGLLEAVAGEARAG